MTNQTSTARETAARVTDSLPAPRSEAGIANLRRRIAATPADGGGGAIGLGDPFAEVFANIATAPSPAPAPAPAPGPPAEQPPPENHSGGTKLDAEDADKNSESQTVVDVVIDRPSPAIQAPLPAAETDEEPSQAVELATAQQIAFTTAGANTNASGDVQPDAPPVDAPQVVLEHDRDEPTIAVPVVIAPANDQVDDAVIDAEVVVGASLDHDRSHSDSKSTKTQAEAIPTAAEGEMEPNRANADPQASSAGPLESKVQASSGEQKTPANTPVERRRYTDRSEQQAARNETVKPQNHSTSDANVAANPHSNDTEPSPRANTSTANGGVDISSMTATQSSPALSAAATAALAATRSAGAAATTGVGGKTASLASVTGSHPASQSSAAPSSFGLDRSGTSPGESKAAATKSSTGVDTSAAVARAKLAQRVSRGFQHLGAGGGQIRMRLSPDHLGSVQLQMTIQNGKLNGRMVAQSDQAAQLLREQLPSLRASLESQGIRMERIDIETDSSLGNASGQSGERQSGDTPNGFAGHQSAGQQNETGGQHRSRTSRINTARRNQNAAAKLETASSAPIHSLPILPGSVDLHV